MRKEFLWALFWLFSLPMLGQTAQHSAGQYSDIRWAEAQGMVQSIIETTAAYTMMGYDISATKTIYRFYTNGRLLSVSVNGQSRKISLDAAGRIHYIYAYAPDPEGGDAQVDYGITYTYDPYQLPARHARTYLEAYEEFVFQFDERGWRKTALSICEGDCGIDSVCYSYTYPVIDAQGNWLRRIELLEYRDFEDNQLKTVRVVTTREITYWD